MKQTSALAHFRRIYPECSYKEVRDLVEAIRGDKYWFVHPGKRDALYVVALTRAQIPTAQGYRARATYVGPISLTSEASPYCRRGRVIALTRQGGKFVGKCMIRWPEFLQLINLNSELVYNALLENQLPNFVNRAVMKRLRQKFEPTPSPTS